VHQADQIAPSSIHVLPDGNDYIFLIINHSDGYERAIQEIREAAKALKAKGSRAEVVVIDARHRTFTRASKGVTPGQNPNPLPANVNFCAEAQPSHKVRPNTDVAAPLKPAPQVERIVRKGLRCPTCGQGFNSRGFINHLKQHFEIDSWLLIESVLRVAVKACITSEVAPEANDQPIERGEKINCPICNGQYHWIGILEHAEAVHRIEVSAILEATLPSVPMKPLPGRNGCKRPKVEIVSQVATTSKSETLSDEVRSLLETLYDSKNDIYAEMRQAMQRQGHGSFTIKKRLVEHYLLERFATHEGSSGTSSDARQFRREVKELVEIISREQPPIHKWRTPRKK
jgi:hypothetical protein